MTATLKGLLELDLSNQDSTEPAASEEKPVATTADTRQYQGVRFEADAMTVDYAALGRRMHGKAIAKRLSSTLQNLHLR